MLAGPISQGEVVVGSKDNPIDLTGEDTQDIILNNAKSVEDVECEICCHVRTGKMVKCIKCVGECCIVCLIMTDQCPFCRVPR